MATRNYQVLFVKQGIAEVRECEMPAAGAGELLIRARVSLVSPGTERAFLLGLANTSPLYPQGSGYSHIGEVVAVGAGVEGWVRWRSCGLTGPTLACTQLSPARDCNHLPDGLTDARAVFFRLASICHAGGAQGSH